MTQIVNGKRWIVLLACSLAIVLFSDVASGVSTCTTQNAFEGCTKVGLGTSNWWWSIGTTEIDPPQSWLFIDIRNYGYDHCDVLGVVEKWDSYPDNRVYNTHTAGWVGDAQYDESGCDPGSVLRGQSEHYAAAESDVWTTTTSICPHPGSSHSC